MALMDGISYSKVAQKIASVRLLALKMLNGKCPTANLLTVIQKQQMLVFCRCTTLIKVAKSRNAINLVQYATTLVDKKTRLFSFEKRLWRKELVQD